MKTRSKWAGGSAAVVNRSQRSSVERKEIRSDLRNLFDLGYLTVTLDYRVKVSRRIREEAVLEAGGRRGV
jgi:hypothetical protein